MEMLGKHWRLAAVGTLAIVNILIWQAVSAAGGPGVLRVSFFDVGQGDAIFIEGPTGNQVLVDAGKTGEVLRRLGEAMPYLDKSIDVIIATHPDADHIGGFPDVLARYDVGVLLEPGVESDAAIDDEMRRIAEERGVEMIEARRGMIVDLGGGAKLNILFPDRDMDGADTNDASIVAVLAYGETEFLLTGDSPKGVEAYLIGLDGEKLDVEVLKAGHHGSKTSTMPEFAAITSPEYSIISAGKDNSYGHPHQEVLDALTGVGAVILKTYEEGTITFESDGKEVIKK